MDVFCFKKYLLLFTIISKKQKITISKVRDEPAFEANDVKFVFSYNYPIEKIWVTVFDLLLVDQIFVFMEHS